MHLIEDTINKRRILYTDIGKDLTDLKNIKLRNWVLLTIEDDATNPVLWEFANLCIDKELLYMMAVGKAGSKIDDIFDEAMLARELEGQKMPYWKSNDDDVLMTAWDDNLDEGFWFITSVANYDDYLIETVLVANLTSKDYLPIIKELSNKIFSGWLPST